MLESVVLEVRLEFLRTLVVLTPPVGGIEVALAGEQDDSFFRDVQTPVKIISVHQIQPRLI